MFDAVTVPPVLRTPVGKTHSFKQSELTHYVSACSFDTAGNPIKIRDTFESGLFVDILDFNANATKVKLRVATLLAIKQVTQGACTIDLIESKSSESIYTTSYRRGAVETVGNYQINITLE